MGTFQDLAEAALASEEWCKEGVDAWALSPMDPVAYYALTAPEMYPTRPFDWFHLLHIANAAQAKIVFLGAVQDYADSLPAGDNKTRLNALAAETADLDAYETWYIDGRADKQAPRRFVGGAIAYLQDYVRDDDIFAPLRAIRTLTGAKALLDGTTELVAEQALMTAFKTRCTEAEFVNGLT